MLVEVSLELVELHSPSDSEDEGAGEGGAGGAAIAVFMGKYLQSNDNILGCWIIA